ncbi:archaetidylserine decarboxylase [Gallaecimonas mangrovi]|uniref:archaetidylserine decarboxylase n=1 Tax=Gallaecimonas mangrovi TaxID=2291597 RepID=UPI001D02384B|nr:archaetidylserine decarboxylase [Gallaecimonas mangrovi]
MFDQLKIALQYLIPQHGLSRLTGALASARAGWLTRAFIRFFINRYKVDMSEAKLESPEDFDTFNAFFTRELKPGLRPLASSDLILPVDGTVSQLGPVTAGRIIQAKGHDYSCDALVGVPELAAPYQSGSFATIYLAPRDYHRIHMPVKGTLTDMIYVPGDLFSVNPLTAENVPGLFARNERVVTLWDTEVGPMALVLVGATIVASIETVWAGTVTPPTGKEVRHWDYRHLKPITLEKGEEMGRFKLGSTVVLLFAENAVQYTEELAPGVVTRLGGAFANKPS